MTFGSLFSGIGGFDLGLERSGMRCEWQVEIDEFCLRVLAKHWPSVRRFKDIRKFALEDAKELKVDVICGGFPCQPESFAGKRKGAEDERWLWPEFSRVIRVLMPRYVIVENVPGLLSGTFPHVLRDLAQSGYDAEWQVLSAAQFGAPHLRKRVWLVAYPHSETVQRKEIFRLQQNGDHGGFEEMANSNSQHGYLSRPNSSEAQFQEEAKILEHSSADSNSKWKLQQEGDESTIWGRVGNSCWWTVEPRLDRVAHGVSFGLVFLGGRISDEESNDQEANTKSRLAGWKVLRELWHHRELAATSPDILGERLRNIVPELPCPSRLSRWVAKEKATQELCGLWEEFYAKSFEEAQNMQQKLLERARQEERRQTLAFKKQRVNRLRSLGNSLVPQIAEWIGRRIIEQEAA